MVYSRGYIFFAFILLWYPSLNECMSTNQSSTDEMNFGEYSSAEINDLVRKDPLVAYRLLRMKYGCLETKHDNLKTKYNGLQKKYDKESVLARFSCTNDFLEKLMETFSKEYLGEPARKLDSDKDYLNSEKYTMCYYFLNGSGIIVSTGNETSNGTVKSKKLLHERVYLKMVQIATKHSEKKARLMKIIDDAGIEVHEFCYAMWKTYKIRSEVKGKLKDILKQIDTFKLSMKDIICPSFSMGELDFNDGDEKCLNAMLKACNFNSRIRLVKGIPEVDICHH